MAKRKPAPVVPTVRLKLDGKVYDLIIDPDEFSPVDEFDLWKQSDKSLTIRTVFAEAFTSGSVIFVAALLFLARRQAGDRTANYMEILGGLSYSSASEIEVELVDNNQAGDDSPEA